MPIAGKIEVTVKITQLPSEVHTKRKNGWKQFTLDCDGHPVIVTLRPRMWNKLEHAQANYAAWVGQLSGRMGQRHGQGFVLVEPNLQVFEKKAKAPAEAEAEAEAKPAEAEAKPVEVEAKPSP